MGNKLLEELRRDLVDGKLRIMHNGIDIYIDCPETGDKLIIPMTSANSMQPSQRPSAQSGRRTASAVTSAAT